MLRKLLLVVFVLFQMCIAFVGCNGTSVNSSSTKSNFSNYSMPTTDMNPIDSITVDDVPDEKNIIDNVANGSVKYDLDWGKLEKDESIKIESYEDINLSAEKTWLLYNRVFAKGNNAYFTVDQLNLNKPINYVRVTDHTYNVMGTTITRCYTVYRSELGGYVYIFMNYRPDDNQLQVRATMYVPQKLSLSDFSHINITDSIDKVVEVDPSANYRKKNIIAGQQPQTFHLLTDGFLIIIYDNINNELFVKEMLFYENFIVPYKFGSKEETYDDEERIRDYYILPQDYPPET